MIALAVPVSRSRAESRRPAHARQSRAQSMEEGSTHHSKEGAALKALMLVLVLTGTYVH